MEQINLNIIPDGVMPVCHASQFDKNRTIRFNLNQNGSVYTLAGTETITCKVRKPDGTESTINVANTSSSYVDVTFGFSDTDLSGYAMCELKIVNGAQIIGSRNFLLNVEADAYDGSVFEERSASGAVASFETNFIDNLTECIVDIDAVQDLHGYSKPWSGGGGKNKAHVTATSQTINEVAYTVATDGRVKANGTANGMSILDLGTITLTGETSYILSGCPSGGSGLTYALFLRGSGTFTQKLDFGTGVSFTVTDTVTTTLSMIVYNGYNINNLIFEPMVRLSNTSADFEPYENICPISGHSTCTIKVNDDIDNPQTEITTAIALGTTVYGGSLNVTTGELIITHGYVDLGSLTWVKHSSLHAFFTVEINDFKYDKVISGNDYGIGICSEYDFVQNRDWVDNTICLYHEESTGFVRCFVCDSDKWDNMTDAQFKTAMSGVQLVYELATPTTTQLTPTEVRTLLNDNNIFADTGDIEVKYLIEVV